jgi:hypothetical protein
MPECKKMGWRREKLRDGIASVIEEENCTRGEREKIGRRWERRSGRKRDS